MSHTPVTPHLRYARRQQSRASRPLIRWQITSELSHRWRHIEADSGDNDRSPVEHLLFVVLIPFVTSDFLIFSLLSSYTRIKRNPKHMHDSLPPDSSVHRLTHRTALDTGRPSQKGEAIFGINFTKCLSAELYFYLYVFVNGRISLFARTWNQLHQSMSLKLRSVPFVICVIRLQSTDSLNLLPIGWMAEWLNGKRKTNYLFSFILVWCSRISFSQSSATLRATWVLLQ